MAWHACDSCKRSLQALECKRWPGLAQNNYAAQHLHNRSMAAAYAVELDQHSARHYADKGAAVLLLNVPEATHIAFDHQVSALAPAFLSMKARQFTGYVL